jgi:uncharacterized RDD family membrane protein YckC
VLSCISSLLTGVEASAAQKRPVTKTCLQCGAVQPSNVRVCSFCESPLVVGFSSNTDSPEPRGRRDPLAAVSLDPDASSGSPASFGTDAPWRGELANRLHTYRAKRRRVAPNIGQNALPFEESAFESSTRPTVVTTARSAIATAETATMPARDEDFAFTIAIGRNAATKQDPRMLIDVSLSPETSEVPEQAPAAGLNTQPTGQFPVASMEERRLAGLIDAACLFFAYGGFLALFGSLGGQFTFSKLSAAVCVTTFVIVYLQYFALFTVFGGTTPGMMLRGLHVVSFSGEAPGARQMLWRSLGYMLSAGTFFMGFLWSMWDEDSLTWHDRLSQTYLCAAPTFADIDATHAAHTR